MATLSDLSSQTELDAALAAPGLLLLDVYTQAWRQASRYDAERGDPVGGADGERPEHGRLRHAHRHGGADQRYFVCHDVQHAVAAIGCAVSACRPGGYAPCG